MADPGENNELGIITDNAIRSSNFVTNDEVNAAKASMEVKTAEFKRVEKELNDKNELQSNLLKNITNLNQEINFLTRTIITLTNNIKAAEDERGINTAERKKIKDELEKGENPVLEARLEKLDERHEQLSEQIIPNLLDEKSDSETELADKNEERKNDVANSNTLRIEISGLSNEFTGKRTELLEATDLFNRLNGILADQQNKIIAIASVNTTPTANLARQIIDNGVSLESVESNRDSKYDELKLARNQKESSLIQAEVAQFEFNLAGDLEKIFRSWETRFNHNPAFLEKNIILSSRNYTPTHGGNLPEENEPPMQDIFSKYRTIGAELGEKNEAYIEALEIYNELVRKLNELPGEILNLEKLILELEKTIQTLQDLNNQTNQDIEDTKDLVSTTKSNKTEIIEEKLPKVENDIRDLIKEKTTKEGNIANAKDELDSVKSEKEGAVNDLSKTNADITTIEGEIKTLKDRIKVLEEIEGRNADEEKELKDKSDELEKKESGKTNLEEDQSKIQEFINKLTASIDDLEKTIASDKASVETTQNNINLKNKEKEGFEAERDKLEREEGELKLRVSSLQESLDKNEKKLEENQIRKAESEKELADKNEELKYLKDNNNEVVNDGKTDMEEKLKLYNDVRNNFITTEQSNTPATLKEKIEKLESKINEVDEKTAEINAIQEAIIPLKDAKNLTAQIISAIRPMVESENDQERKVINEARAKSAELKDDQGRSINFTAKEANKGTSSNKHGMVQSNLFIRRAMENDEKFCLIPTNITVEPAELATLANYGFNLSFINVGKREPGTDIFSEVPQLRISWEVPNDENLDSYGFS